VVKNFEWWCVKMGSGSQNGKWWSKWWIILIAGLSKWEVAVKMADNFKWWWVKWEVAVKVVDNFNCQFVKMGSGSQSGG
jgi:hypothetical protein